MSVRRRTFIALAGAALAIPAVRSVAQDDADPATNAQAQSLRVLLGQGEAQEADRGFIFEGRPYRGTFARLNDGSIVNLVGVEQYLYSVVPREMSPSWPDAALQAQAICARTYVLQRSNPKRDYDLVPSELDQVYHGVTGESPAGRAAVDGTNGQVLRFAQQFASVAYSSCCGGHTESSADAWGGTAVPYLRGVACGFCNESPNYRWSDRLALGDVEQRLADRIGPLGQLKDVRIAGTDGSGRARAFELACDHGSVSVKGSTFRLSVGARVIRSLLISRLSVDRSAEVAIEGGGLGHGVGLCQWGARGMAIAGRTARDILAWYFPGTELAND